ncbi:hypothetical protein [Streptomyces sp. NBC_00009]|uniref:hypothetical protein n=1 Tax=Streptomyces sp. NBC_00009 TaxID=2975620 RepID=UPI0032525474
MKTEWDSLATALYVKTDDLLKGSPQFGPWRPAVGIAPQLSDADLQRILALTAAIWHNDHIDQPILRALTAYDH